VVATARQAGKTELAEQQHAEIRAHYDQIAPDVVQRRDVEEAAGIVWYYTVVYPAPDEAKPFATLLASSNRRSPGIRRALGYSLLNEQKYDDALTELRIIADECPWAGLAVGRAYLALGDNERAYKALSTAAELRGSGPAYPQIIALLAEQPTTQPTPREYPRVKALLDGYDRRKFDFFARPQDHIQLVAEPMRTTFGVGQSMPLVIRLANTGPFPVTLGDGLMIAPTVRVKATLPGDREVAFASEFMVSLNRRPALAPGEQVAVPTRVDVGPLRKYLANVPERDFDIMVDMLLSPVQVQGAAGVAWTYEPGGFATEGCRLQRPAMNNTTAHIEQLLHDAGTPGPGQIDAVEQLAAYSAERARRSTAGWPLPDPDQLVPRVTDVLTDTLQTAQWHVRCHILEGLRWHPLSGKLAQAAAEQISNGDWRVRLMAVRLFAHQHGRKFMPVLEHLATEDPEPVVRRLAEGVRQSLAPPHPATQPAETE
jgi:hypothetical protein